MSTSAVTPAIAAVTWPEGKEYSLSAYAPAACHQVRKGSTVSGRGRATKSLSQKFVMSAPQHTAPNMQMPILRVFGNSISGPAQRREEAAGRFGQIVQRLQNGVVIARKRGVEPLRDRSQFHKKSPSRYKEYL